jgi:hypothetical protein
VKSNLQKFIGGLFLVSDEVFFLHPRRTGQSVDVMQRRGCSDARL